METQAEWKARLTALGLDPNFPIKAGRRYKVTGFSDSEPTRAMRVTVSHIDGAHVSGYVTQRGWMTHHSTWTRAMAERWTWMEIDTCPLCQHDMHECSC